MVETSQVSNQIQLARKPPSGYIVRYPESTELKLLTFSYLAGCDLFHKIALTCKSLRKLLPNSGLLDQIKIITIKKP